MVFKTFISFYTNAITKRPWLTTMISTGCLCGSGDVLAQQVVENRGKSHDIYRTGKFVAMGSLFIGPSLRTWYIVLDKLVKGASTTTAIKKMALDQVLFAPSFIAAFFTVSEKLDGKSFGKIQGKLMAVYIPTLKANYYIWPVVQAVNFYLVPFQHRILVVNFVALFWNTFLAFKAHQKHETEA